MKDIKEVKMHCMVCKEPKELTREELKDTAKFVIDNNLDSEGYEDYMSTKLGKKCKGVDGKSEKLKKHKFIIDEENIKELNDIAIKAKEHKDEHSKIESEISSLNTNIEKLMKERDEKTSKLPDIENLIIKDKDMLIEMIENDNFELWL